MKVYLWNQKKTISDVLLLRIQSRHTDYHTGNLLLLWFLIGQFYWVLIGCCICWGLCFPAYLSMPSPPCRLLTRHRAIPCPVALSTCKKQRIVFRLLLTFRANFWPISFKFTAVTMAPKVKWPEKPSPPQSPRHWRVNVGREQFVAFLDVSFSNDLDPTITFNLSITNLYIVCTRVV